MRERGFDRLNVPKNEKDLEKFPTIAGKVALGEPLRPRAA